MANINADLEAKINKIASQLNISRSEVLRRALLLYLKINHPEKEEEKKEEDKTKVK
jgi:metal-responsive CopG/Arc/MetJ family transcriptional regulator